MSNLVLILSENPEGPFVTQFNGFIRENFPQAQVQKENYSLTILPAYAVVFAEIFPPVLDFEARARNLARAGRIVFALSEGLGNTLADLKEVGARLPSDPRPGPLYGLAGVVYKMRDEPFWAFDKEDKSGPARTVLKNYIH